MRFSLIALVVVCHCSAPKDAIASCHLAGSFDGTYLQVPDHLKPLHEASLELVGVITCRSSWLKNFEFYLETGVGLTSERRLTWPIGIGFLFDISHNVGVGVATTYNSHLGYFGEGSLQAGPLLQYTLVEQEDSDGHLSVIFIPSFISHHSPAHPWRHGLGLTIGLEFAPSS